jgi:hypothetical protein
MNKNIGWVILVLVVLALGYWAYSASTEKEPSDGTYNSAIKGNVNVSFTDDTADMENITEVSMKVEQVELYNETHGWVIVSTNNVEYKLLALKSRSEKMIYGTGKIAADTYTKTRVTIGTVNVMTRGNGNKVAILPSKIFTADVQVIVKADSETSLRFDVLADRSLRTTAKADIIFAPVMNIESRSDATVGTTVTGIVTISGGSIDTNKDYGMDIDGNVKADFKLDTNVKLNVGVNGAINTILN